MSNPNNLITFKDDQLEIQINVSPQEDTVWLTQDQLSQLFDKNKSTISRHIKNVFDSGELNQHDSVTKKATKLKITDYRTGKAQDATRILDYYNLDVIIFVGYRVNSSRGVIFRKRANKVLKEFMLKGYAVDQERLAKSADYYKSFTRSVQLIANLIEKSNLGSKESKSLLQIYDHQSLTITSITKDDQAIKLDYAEAMKQIQALPDYQKS